MGARSEEKALAAIEDVKQQTPDAEVHSLKMDLNNLESVVEAAKDFLQVRILFRAADWT